MSTMKIKKGDMVKVIAGKDKDKEGITPAVVNSADEAIEKRELIKVRVLQNCPEDIEVAITTLAERTNCDLVQVIGRNGLLWRRNFKKPKIELPK